MVSRRIICATALRYEQRQTDSAEVLNEFKQWLDNTQRKVAPKNTLGKAVNYTLTYWMELSSYQQRSMADR